jgi:hypothetical protein
MLVPRYNRSTRMRWNVTVEVNIAYILKYCQVHEYGFGLMIRFIDHLNTQLVTTGNYNSLTGLHTLKITVRAALIKSCMSLLVVS